MQDDSEDSESDDDFCGEEAGFSPDLSVEVEVSDSSRRTADFESDFDNLQVYKDLQFYSELYLYPDPSLQPDLGQTVILKLIMMLIQILILSPIQTP